MPYFYLYDSYLADRAYVTQLIRLENTLADLGIQGRVGRLTLLKSVKDILQGALRDGADTIIAVGNNLTLSRLIEVLATNTKITLGFIPLGAEQQSLAELLGIPIGLLACQVISSRVVEKLSVGRANDQYFIKSVEFVGMPTLECDKHFKLKLITPHHIKICNLDWCTSSVVSNPQNDTLEVVLTPKPARSWLPWAKSTTLAPSLIPFPVVKITSGSRELTMNIDDRQIIKAPATISLASDKIRMIVGKKRLF